MEEKKCNESEICGTNENPKPAKKKKPIWLRILIGTIAGCIGVFGSQWVINNFKPSKESYEVKMKKNIRKILEIKEMNTFTFDNISVDIPVFFKEDEGIYYCEDTGTGITIIYAEKTEIEKTFELSNLNEYAEFCVQSANTMDGYKLLSSQPTNINGFDAYQHKFNATVKSIVYQYEQYFVDGGENIENYYILQFSLLKDNAQELAPLVQEIVNSLKILK